MKTLLIAAVAAAFAATGAAQTPITSAPPMDTKAKQESVEATTKAATEGYGAKAAKGSAEAAKTKDTPKVLTDKKSKQQTVKSVTESTAGTGYTQSAAAGSAKAAADKTPKKPKPKMGDYEKELQKASTP